MTDPKPLTVPQYMAERERILRDLVRCAESDDPRVDELIQLARYIETRRPRGT